MDGQVLNQVAELARAATQAATAATAIASQFSSRGSSSMESVSLEPGHCASLWGHLV